MLVLISRTVWIRLTIKRVMLDWDTTAALSISGQGAYVNEL